jgi:hypothetical protein
MSTIHPRETELACACDKEPSADLVEHLRWCARCRNAAADYRWLESNLGVTLATAACALPVPRPAWRAVRERLSTGQQRLAAGRRLSVVASVALVVCVMLVASPALGAALGAQTLLPRVAVHPSLATVFASGGEDASSMMTPTPVLSGEKLGSSPTCALALPPTQPRPDTLSP